MNVYLISDTHFNHKSVISKYGRQEDFQEILLHNLSKIEEDSLLIHLGDFCFGKLSETAEMYSNLPGRKILVRGNHDNKSNSWYLSHGFDFVCDSFTIKVDGKVVLFSHQPVVYDKNTTDMNIHGHLHANRHRGDTKNFKFRGRNYRLISMEFLEYKPILLKDVVRLGSKEDTKLSTGKVLKKCIKKYLRKIVEFIG